MNKFFLTLILVFILTGAYNQSKAQWSIGGNDLSADGILGSTVSGDPWDLVFVTEGLTRMKIASNGKVGVGDFSLTDPTHAFDILNTINGKSLFITNDYNTTNIKYGIHNTVGNLGTGGRYGIYNLTTSDATSGAINYGIYSSVTHPGTGDAYGLYSFVDVTGSGTHYGVYSQAFGAGNYALYAKGRAYFSDKVGIGITSPEASLHIKQTELDLAGGGSIILGPTSAVNLGIDANEIQVRNNGAAGTFHLNREGGTVIINEAGVVEDVSLNTDGALRIGNSDDRNLIFDTGEIQARDNGGASGLFLNAEGGNVGIGTTFAPEKLSVCGTVKATEIVVEATWCDYVFDKNYKLMPLNELSLFLEQNKHLPNIPSAVEIEEGGLALGNVTAKMMEKIEELALYTLQLNTRINQLETENVELRSSLTSNK